MSRLLITLLLCCCLAPAYADQRAETQRQLEQARKDIAELKKVLGGLEREKSGVQQELSKTEREMGSLEKQIRDLQQQLKQSESELKRLNQEQGKLNQARQEQQRLIAIQARAAYQSGRQEYLKLLLNQEHPERISRTLTYYEYLSQARLEQLTAFQKTLDQLAAVERDIESERQRLDTQTQDIQQRRDQLAKVRQERQQVLAKLNRDSNVRSQSLKQREQDQAELAKVLKSIEETLARQAREAEAARQRALAAERERQARERATAATPRKTPPRTDGPLVSSAGSNFGGPFGQARGKLPWPVNGRLLARFGSPRPGDARLKWDGVLIGAAAGSQVKAVHGGRVVFADWLRGAGLLVILDHGGGYLSLYGHNQSLLKSTGDVVKAGEVISTVGNSGGQDMPALYFAIRQQGRPSDPVQWCRAQG